MPFFEEGETVVRPCTSCRRYQSCQSLCDKADEYVSQDETRLRELTIGTPYYFGEWPVTKNTHKLTRRQKAVLALWQVGFDREEIARSLGISRPNLRTTIASIRDYFGDFFY